MLQIVQPIKQQGTPLPSFYASSICFLLFTYFLLKWFGFSPFSRKNLPPSPPKLPIIGNLHQLGVYVHRTLQCLAQRHGSDLMMLKFGSVPTLIVSSAEAAREIMKTHDLTFASRPKFGVLEKLLYDCKDIAAAPYGEYWRKMKSLCVLHLLSNRRVQSFRAVREEETGLLIERIQHLSLSSTQVNLSEMFGRVTNDVICRAAFGRKYSEGEAGKKFKKMIAEFMKLMSAFSVGDFVPWLAWLNHWNGVYAKAEKTAKEFDEFLEGIVEEHMKNQETNNSADGGRTVQDFVDVLLELQKDATAEFSINRENIKAIILDIFVGGTENSYTVMEWAMSEMLKKPRVLRELQKEVRGVAQGKTMIREEDLDKLQYLKLVIKETLRLHPPLPLLSVRESTQDANVMGYHIAARTMVFINAFAIGRDPRSWSQAEEFWPERFLNESIDIRGQDFQLIPFGSGRRGCPGISFAMAINELVLANVVKDFDWALVDGVKEEDLDMTECIGLTINRKDPLIAIATPCS